MTEPPPLMAALKGLCPRCGNRTLFAGLATFAPKCRACGLDFAAFNVGDGPAAFLIFIVGGIVVGLAIVTQVRLSPPSWVHVLLWVPLTAILTGRSLREMVGQVYVIPCRPGAAGLAGRIRVNMGWSERPDAPRRLSLHGITAGRLSVVGEDGPIMLTSANAAPPLVPSQPPA